MINHLYGLLDRDGVLLEANDAAVRLIGVGREEVIGRPFWQTPWWSHSPELQQRLREAVAEALAGGEVRFTASHIDDQGRSHAVDFHLHPQRDATGYIRYLVADGYDIEEWLMLEQRQRETEARYHTLFDSLSEPVFILRGHTVVDCNPGAAALFGLPRQEIIGNAPSFFSPPIQADGRPSREKASELLAAADRGEPQVFEWVHRRGDGGEFIVEVHLSHFKVGEEDFYLAMMRDITESRRIHEQLRESQVLLRTVLDNSYDAVVLHDPEGRVVDVNDSMLVLYRLTREQALGMGIADLSAPESPMNLARERWQRVLNGERLLFEWKARRPADDSRFDVEVFLVRVEVGRLDYVLGYVRDISERKAIEQAMQENERNYREIFNAASDAIFIHDARSGAILDVNQSMLDMYGYAREEALGLTIADCSANDEQYNLETARNWILRAQYEGPQVVEWRARRRDGQLFWVEVSLRFSVINRQERVLAVVRDISSRRETERSMRLMQHSIQNVRDMIFLVGDQGRLLYVNQAACRALNYTEAELLSMTVHDIDPDFPPEAWEPHLARLRREGTVLFDSHHRARDGRMHAVEVLSTYIRLDGQEGSFAYARDISERRRNDEELQRSRAEYQLLFDASIDGIIVIADGVIVRANESFARMQERSKGEVLGRSPLESLPQEYRTIGAERIRRMMQGEEVSDRFTYNVCLPGGKPAWFETHSRRIEWEGRQAVLSIIRDVTAWHEAQNRLHRYNERLQILHRIDQAVLSARSAEEVAAAALEYIVRLVPVRRASLVLFDFAQGVARVIGVVQDGEFLVADVISIEEFGIDRALYENRPIRVDDLAQEAELSPLRQKLRAKGIRSLLNIPLFVQGRLIGSFNLTHTEADSFNAEHVEICRELADMVALAVEQARLREEVARYTADLEKRVAERTAQLEAAHRELEAIAYTVSHDLRAPVRHIDGFAGILQERSGAALDEAGRRHLAAIRGASARMDRLISDLLLFFHAGRVELHHQPVALTELTREVAAEMTAQHPGRTIAWEIAELPVVSGDPAQLRRVFHHLFDNAVKFTAARERAEVQVIALAPAADAAGEVVIAVRDNGVGFDPRYADKLFGVFQRLHTGADDSGTGIGLAVARRIMERHHGRIWAEGSVGRGAVFFLAFGGTPPQEEGEDGEARE